MDKYNTSNNGFSEEKPTPENDVGVFSADTRQNQLDDEIAKVQNSVLPAAEQQNAVQDRAADLSAAEQQNLTQGKTVDLSSGDKPLAKNKLEKRSKTLKMATRTVAYTGVLTAMVMLATLLGFSTGQFYFNVGDTVILVAAAVFGPIPAMLAGGLGAFFADMAVYPVTMVFTLFIKAFEGLVAGLLLKIISKFVTKKSLNVLLSTLAMAFSAFLMMTGYFICQTFFYGTYAAALIALPMDAVQAAVSTVLAFTLLYPLKFISFKDKLKMS